MSFKLRSALCAGLLAAATVSYATASAQLNSGPNAFSPDAKTCRPFYPAHLYLTGMNAGYPALGDFNGDGILDLVTVTQQWSGHWEGSITILLGQKGGTFQQGGSYDIGQSPVGNLAVGDFNRDGRLDVASSNSNGTIEVFLGNGDGTFQLPLASPAGAETDFLAAGDFNGDGRLDLAALGSGSVVQVLLGKGDGTFQSAVTYPVNVTPSGIAVADFDGDGHLDLAVANAGYLSNPGTTVSVLFGKGNGTFGTKKDFTVGQMPFGIVAADFDGDGKIDLATANYLDGTASVLLNKGKRGFRPATSYAAGHPGAPYRVIAAPLKTGEKPSLAVASIAGTYVLVSKGDGTFESAQGYEPQSSELVATDLNGDGNTDLLVAGGYFEEGPTGVTILFGKGRGKFATPTAYVGIPNLSAVAAGDFDEDGKPDLAVADSDGDAIGIMPGLGKGRFSSPVEYYSVAGYPVSIAVGDFNGDKHLDLAVTLFDVNKVQIFLGKGNGIFTRGGIFPVRGQWAWWIRTADFNGDGILDLAVTSQGDYESNGEVSILLGNGDGSFQTATGYSPAQYDEGLAVADFNRDGKLDFAVANNKTNFVNVFLGNGDGTFTQKGSYAAGSNLIDVVAADFNEDGNPDLVTASNASGVSMLLGAGDGSFQLTPDFYPLLDTWRLSIADFTGDGHADLAVVTHNYGMVYLLRGKADGTFKLVSSSNIGVVTYAMAVADLNGDGAPDLAVPNADGGEVSVLLNGCAGR